MAQYSVSCSALSASIVAAGETVGAGPHVLGGTVSAAVALRFLAAAAIGDTTQKIKRCKLAAKVSSVTSTLTVNFDLWAAEYGAAITGAGDYGTAASNVSPIRVKLKRVLTTATLANDTFVASIPPRFVNRDTGSNGGFSDFEIRPDGAGTGLEELAIYGSGGTGQIVVTTDAYGTSTYVSGQIATLIIDAVTPAVELSENSFNEIAVRDGSYLAFDTETTRGLPVKGKYLLDMIDTDLDTYCENLFSEAVQRNRQRPGKAAVGKEGAGGSVNFHPTPEVWVKMLMGWFKVSSTTGSNPYTHSLVPANYKEVPSFTFVKKYGNNSMRNVYRGCMLGTLSLSARYGQLVTASCSIMGRQEWSYTHADAYGAQTPDEYVLSSTAAYDTNGVLSFNGCEVAIDGTTNYGTIPGFTITINNGIAEVEGLRRRRDITGHIVGGMTAEVSFELYFENDVLLRNFAACANLEDPWVAGSTLTFNAITFKLAGPAGATTQEIVFTIEKFLAMTIKKPIPGQDGAIILPVSGICTLGNNAVSNILTVTVMNSQASTIWNASTDTITVIPTAQLLP